MYSLFYLITLKPSKMSKTITLSELLAISVVFIFIYTLVKTILKK